MIALRRKAALPCVRNSTRTMAPLYGLSRDELRYVLDPQEVYSSEFPGEDVPGADDAKRPSFAWRAPRHMVPDRAWGKEKAMKALAAGTLRSRTRRLAEGGEVG
jgi:hypothetical protein